ncbi:LPS export ABC transporter permease LptF [Nitrococcus mobilis]|uniref:Lipopolysaccharide export system permease protein LptF n=1 Tax=Nitrococcus mobilis Nb-231 TaxID=314278 RepID=A4BMW9_9GAMM|nr:LPS export ABC transporter permease LptF [Nitrococcus mobilis]EAR22568.1 permease YjgP/YjgQ [Nitrococcus mobilis Nb-231]
MLLIERYLIAEVRRPLVAVVGVLSLIFASYSVARYLADALSETLGMQAVALMVALRTLIALEVLIPVALYASVVIGLGRLYNDQEMTVLGAVGISSARVYWAILLLALPVALAVGALSLFGRPWAYQQAYQAEAHAHVEIPLDRLRAGHFYVESQTGRMILAQEVDDQRGLLHGVLIYQRAGEATYLTKARQARQLPTEQADEARLILHDGVTYLLDQAGSHDRILRFGELSLRLQQPQPVVGYKRKAAPTAALARSGNPAELAELQWRLSRPLTTVLLALFGVPLSRTAPRRGRFSKILLAALVYALIYSASGLAKTWVEHGVVGAVPGIWWINAVMFVVLVALISHDLQWWRWPRP